MANSAKMQPFNARTYMELAIEEMNKSVNEPRPDGKVPPKVGAILLFPNGRIERAHRGELRDGDHAEFTLIERKLLHQKLDDCILFTTLEPCVKRSNPKIACCKRTTKARIKTVYVGITDPDHSVDGKGILHLEENGVKVIMFDRDFQKIIETENAEFRKQALERKEKAVKEEFVRALEKPLENSTIEEFSGEALSRFISAAKLEYKENDPAFNKFLSEVGVIQYDENKKAYVPNALGILLFGKNPRARFKQAVFKCVVDYGANQTETKDFAQPLVLVPDLVEEWIRKVLPAIKDTSSFKKKEIPAFPIEILREAVVNAIVHRDYMVEGAKSYLQINHDKIVVKSPGAPVPSISLEQLNTFKAPSISRNPIITYVFNLMGYVEEAGFGMEALKQLNQKYELPLPEYGFEEPFLSLTFPRTFEAVKKISQHEGVARLNNEELKGYEFMKLKDMIKRKEYEDHFQFDKKKAERQLNKMLEEGLIERKGSGPGTYYQVIAT